MYKFYFINGEFVERVYGSVFRSKENAIHVFTEQMLEDRHLVYENGMPVEDCDLKDFSFEKNPDDSKEFFVTKHGVQTNVLLFTQFQSGNYPSRNVSQAPGADSTAEHQHPQETPFDTQFLELNCTWPETPSLPTQTAPLEPKQQKRLLEPEQPEQTWFTDPQAGRKKKKQKTNTDDLQRINERTEQAAIYNKHKFYCIDKVIYERLNLIEFRDQAGNVKIFSPRQYNKKFLLDEKGEPTPQYNLMDFVIQPGNGRSPSIVAVSTDGQAHPIYDYGTYKYARKKDGKLERVRGKHRFFFINGKFYERLDVNTNQIIDQAGNIAHFERKKLGGRYIVDENGQSTGQYKLKDLFLDKNCIFVRCGEGQQPRQLYDRNNYNYHVIKKQKRKVKEVLASNDNVSKSQNSSTQANIIELHPEEEQTAVESSSINPPEITQLPADAPSSPTLNFGLFSPVYLPPDIDENPIDLHRFDL